MVTIIIAIKFVSSNYDISHLYYPQSKTNSLFIATKGVVISIVPLNGKTFALKKRESLSWKPLFKVLS